MKPEQLYTETRYLLFTIIKAIPPNISEKADTSLKHVFEEAAKVYNSFAYLKLFQFAREKKDSALLEKIKKLTQNCAKLVEEGILSESDNYAKLRRDTVQELVNYEAQIHKTAMDLERLKAVLKNIHKHNEFLQQQYEAYKEYLANVMQNCGSNPKDDKSKKQQKKGPFKFSHVKLQQDGVIIESEVPEERFIPSVTWLTCFQASTYFLFLHFNLSRGVRCGRDV